ncbi:MAG: cytochrome C oxidase subunit IV family protein [Geobacteraceae bacterium]|nr:cytochrome C oxidase subunit IV family protein [Geobacteraceae bacterium]
MSSITPEQHIVSYGKLVATWLALMALTALTIWVSFQDLGIFRVWAALSIASLKAALVIIIFMQMKYEGRLLKWLLFLTLATLAIFIGLTFVDVLYR